MNRGVDNFRFRDPRRRRFTPDTIIAQTGSLLLPFHSHGDRCDPSYRYCYCFNPHRESLSLYGWFPFVGRGPKRNSEMGIVVGIIVVSIGRRAVRFVELRNEYDISAGRNSYGGTM